MRILVIEDDAPVVLALGAALSASGHSWQRSCRGFDALLQHRHFDILLLDLGLSDIDGFRLLSRLRSISSVPVIAFTDQLSERNVVRALHLGADDHLGKPLRFNELLARIDLVMRRRSQPAGCLSTDVVEVGDVVVDLGARAVTRNGKSIPLTRTEFDVLAILCEHQGEAVSRELILDRVWGDASIGVSRSLSVHLAQLRAKLMSPSLITTIWGHGYRIN